MMDVLEILKLVILFCPFVVLIISYFILKKLKMKQRYAFGFSADITTLLLFIAVPFIVHTVWQYKIYILIIIVAIIIALVLTFVEWRSKKEIRIPTLMRKAWRIYFAILTAGYVGVAVAALISIFIQNI